MYLPEAPWSTVSVICFDPQGIRKECQNFNMCWTWGPGGHNHRLSWKGSNGSYYTGAVRAKSYMTYWAATTGLMEKASMCLWATSRRQKAKKVLCKDQVPAFSIWWNTQFLNSNDVATFRTYCASTLRALHSSRSWRISMVADQSNPNEMVFWDTHFFLLDVETNTPEMSGRYYSFRDRYLLRTLMGHNSSLSLSPSTKSSNEGTSNFSNLGSCTNGFWVLATKSRTWEKVQNFQTRKLWKQERRPRNSLTLLANARTSNKHVFLVRYFSEENIRGSKGGWVRPLTPKRLIYDCNRQK